MENNNSTSFKLRSEEVQELLTRIPHWLVRWGSMLVFFILALLVLVSYIIKYPDIISTQIIITTNTPPQKLIAKTSGKIEAILVADKSSVLKNTPLAIIESSANYKDVFLLKSILDTIDIETSKFPFEEIQSIQLGDIESSYAIFQKEYTTQYLNQKLQPYKVEGVAYNLEAIQIKERLHLLESQKIISQKELELAKQDLERYQTLFDKGIIASQELEKHKLNYLSAEKGYKNLLSSISSLKSSLNELNKNSQATRINESKENVTLQHNVIQSFYQLKKVIKDWELNYVFRSSIDGKVSFLQVWTENQVIANGDNVFSIVPNTQNGFIGKIKAPAQNSGKIQVGQLVNIRLASFPDREFGVVKGVVKTISLTPDKEGNLLIDVLLPNRLETTYKKKIVFQQEMTGTADIVTKELRLSDRILHQFRSIIDR